MACDDRQISQAQREAGYNQQRTGVVQALRPFSGAPTLENLLDYLNRELVPAVRATRNAANDIYLQVADNAPSANPLAYYFSTDTAASDPTTGRIKLNASPQDTATIIRVSESNARLQSVIPWLDVMSGGPTTPLGTVTLVDAINPGRFLRFDLNTMTDQGAYWDLGVTFIEGSHDDPFVQDEAVVLGFISGVSAAGSTVPVGSLSPIARDTFIGNIGTTTAPPVAVPLADVDSTSIVYDATSHTYQRAALTGFATAAQNSNATSSAEPIVTYSASANMSAERVLTSSTSNTVSTAVANQIAVERAALTGAIAASANSNATLFSGIRNNGSDESDRTSLNFISTTSISCSIGDDGANDELELVWHRAALTGAITASLDSNATRFAGILDNGSAESDRTSLNFVSSTSCTLVVTDDGANDELEITAQRAALTGEVTAGANANATTITRSTSFGTAAPWTGAHRFEHLVQWQGIDSATLSAQSDDRAIGNVEVVRLSLSGDQTLTGMAPGGDGQLVFLFSANSTTDEFLTLEHESGSSSAANRFSLPNHQDMVIPAKGGVLCRYDASLTRWVVATPRVSAFASIITPGNISSNQNNYNPTGWATATVVRLSTNSATMRDITGAAAGTTGELKWLVNQGPGNIRLQSEDASSSAANRFVLTSGTTFTIVPDGVVGILYDDVSERWRPTVPQVAF